MSEQLISVIRERVRMTTDSDIATACLMALADRGVFTMQELPDAAYRLVQRFPDQSAIVGTTVDTFARAAGLPLYPEEVANGH